MALQHKLRLEVTNHSTKRRRDCVYRPGKIADHPPRPCIAQLRYFQARSRLPSREVFRGSFQNLDFDFIEVTLVLEVILPVDFHHDFLRFRTASDEPHLVAQLVRSESANPLFAYRNPP